MIRYYSINKESIQIYGNKANSSVSGIAYKKHVMGNQRKVWQYSLTILNYPKMIKIDSNPKDGTMSTKSKLKERIDRLIEEYENKGGANED